MIRTVSLFAGLLLGSGFALAEKAVDATFYAYVDSDVCAHVMVGPVTDTRIECSEQRYGSDLADVSHDRSFNDRPGDCG